MEKLEVKHVSKTFEDGAVLDDISITLHQGEEIGQQETAVTFRVGADVVPTVSLTVTVDNDGVLPEDWDMQDLSLRNCMVLSSLAPKQLYLQALARALPRRRPQILRR